jgi:hypothetical protein
VQECDKFQSRREEETAFCIFFSEMRTGGRKNEVKIKFTILLLHCNVSRLIGYFVYALVLIVADDSIAR